jgi:hypothetical protein
VVGVQQEHEVTEEAVGHCEVEFVIQKITKFRVRQLSRMVSVTTAEQSVYGAACVNHFLVKAHQQRVTPCPRCAVVQSFRCILFESGGGGGSSSCGSSEAIFTGERPIISAPRS